MPGSNQAKREGKDKGEGNRVYPAKPQSEDWAASSERPETGMAALFKTFAFLTGHTQTSSFTRMKG